MPDFRAAESKAARSSRQQHAAGSGTYLNGSCHGSSGFERLDAPRFGAVMVLGEPVLWAVIVFAIVAFEWKIDFCPARSAFHEVGSLAAGHMFLLLTFNVGTPSFVSVIDVA